MLRRNLADVLEIYLDQNTLVTSETTVKHYRMTLRKFSQFLGSNAKLKHLTDANLAAFMKHILAQGRAIPTVNQKRDYVCALWRWCAKTGRVKLWPTVPAMVEPEIIPDAWSIQEIRKIFRACKEQTGTICGIPASKWWHSIHLFWWMHGERLSATLAARWCDYNGQELLIPAASRKGGQKAMLYDLMPEVRRAIDSIKRPNREMIWPWKPSHDFHYYYRRRILRAAGLRYVPYRSGPQKMRRSYASWLTANGGDATKGLGHSTSALTVRSYIDPRIAKPVNQSALLPKVG